MALTSWAADATSESNPLVSTVFRVASIGMGLGGLNNALHHLGARRAAEQTLTTMRTIIQAAAPRRPL